MFKYFIAIFSFLIVASGYGFAADLGSRRPGTQDGYPHIGHVRANTGFVSGGVAAAFSAIFLNELLGQSVPRNPEPASFGGFVLGAGAGWAGSSRQTHHIDSKVGWIAPGFAVIGSDGLPILTRGSVATRWQDDVASVYSGYTFQNGQMTFGALVDANWLASTGGRTVDVVPTRFGGWSVSHGMKWQIGLAARAGWVLQERWHVYGKAGLAFGSVHTKFGVYHLLEGILISGETEAAHIWFNRLGKRTVIKAGWLVGGGIEYRAAGPWLLGVDAQYVDLGRQRASHASYGGTRGAVRHRYAAMKLTVGYQY